MKFRVLSIIPIILLLSSTAYAQDSEKPMAEQMIGYMQSLVDTARANAGNCDAMASALQAKQAENQKLLNAIPYSSEHATDPQAIQMKQLGEELGKAAAACYDHAGVQAFFEKLGNNE